MPHFRTAANGAAPDEPFEPKRSSDYTLSSRPIVGLRDEYPAGFVDPPHSHSRIQLLYACSGVMNVTTADCSYAVPPERALWIGAGIEHEVSCRNDVSLRTLYIATELCRTTAQSCRLVEMSPFLQALVLEIVDFDTDRPPDERQELIFRLFLTDVDNMPDAPYAVPMPQDERLRQVCRLIAEKPDTHADLDELSERACMSRRAFTRQFRQETGSSFGDWRRQLRLVEALSLMDAGHSITSTAYEVGYSSPSAFSAAFHRAFGVPPTQYRSPQQRRDP
jgi:AraC-like DNA-binding protein